MNESDKGEKLIFCVLTTSDTRNASNDKSGRTIRIKLELAGHKVFESRLCRDDKKEIEFIVEEWLRNPNVNAIISTGGTGIGFRDVTIETIVPYFTKRIDGFGELFRYLSYTEDVGSKALLSRAAAGVIQEKVFFALPGSVKAVELAMDKLILPEIHHIVDELTKHLKR
ncbi:MogA/MoaB family molybdenum cofactor biosynthesis protein [Sporosarcina sp. E16_8]|uniref:MogA/MoaB family molybdenum cofactor biosynthesis protein n=1 Tax=Sporosarcina sp. E16_8 TaxID=2789295 RepID=UPI001A92A961|nr:MogA/MoaB family molybdenum cofactor biosynthesis protein [Sporosarcina sp. E16_8]MBO0586769.1 MogA/MoaB family molybdenum cofactor biosynthesis protein [Sporosarcina sp. E16_8]